VLRGEIRSIMADQDNFEEDLFADLYDDNDASKPAPATTTSGNVAESAPAAATQDNGAAGAEDANNDQEEDDDDDDDDVDFNLGGPSTGMNSNTAAAETVSHSMPETRDSHDVYGAQDGGQSVQTPTFGSVHKASAKDDG